MQRPERWVYAALAAYAVGFLLLPPRVLLIIDEFHYVAQALAFAQGELTLAGAAPLFPPSPLGVPSNYPPGTSLLQAPFVAIAGWRAAAALSVLSLVCVTLITMRWLRDNGLAPGFAMLIPGFAGALFFGRTAMSDVPSAMFVALSLWLLWRAESSWTWSALAGLVGGLTLLFREPVAVLLAPFFLGAIARRKCIPWAVIAGGAAGIAVRLALYAALFGSALYVRDSGHGFSLGAVLANLPAYGAILLVMFPLGALLPLVYRGPRRAEFVTSVALYVALFLLYDYHAAQDAGRTRGILLASRFMVPLLPVLAFMAADVVPRVVGARLKAEGSSWWGVRIAFAGIVMAAFAIHPLVRRQEREALSIVNAIYGSTRADVPVITNSSTTLKYLSPAYGTRLLILRPYITAADVPRFFREHGTLSIAILDRADGAVFQRDAAENATFLSDLKTRCSTRTEHDGQYAGMRLRVLTVVACSN